MVSKKFVEGLKKFEIVLVFLTDTLCHFLFNPLGRYAMQRRDTDGGCVLSLPGFEIKTIESKTQFRLKIPGSGKLSLTLVHSDAMPSWEKPHFHLGLWEVYVVFRGDLGFVLLNSGGTIDGVVVGERGDRRVIVFPPNMPHNVFLTPQTLFSVATAGVPVVNPDKSDNDWYDAADTFVNNVCMNGARTRVQQLLS